MAENPTPPSDAAAGPAPTGTAGTIAETQARAQGVPAVRLDDLSLAAPVAGDHLRRFSTTCMAKRGAAADRRHPRGSPRPHRQRSRHGRAAQAGVGGRARELREGARRRPRQGVHHRRDGARRGQGRRRRARAPSSRPTSTSSLPPPRSASATSRRRRLSDVGAIAGEATEAIVASLIGGGVSRRMSTRPSRRRWRSRRPEMFEAPFWALVSLIIFLGIVVYLKVPGQLAGEPRQARPGHPRRAGAGAQAPRGSAGPARRLSAQGARGGGGGRGHRRSGQARGRGAGRRGAEAHGGVRRQPHAACRAEDRPGRGAGAPGSARACPPTSPSPPPNGSSPPASRAKLALR